MTQREQTLAWYPVAASDDLVRRHVFWGQLFGRELALWRADDGHVNVWENRCLHRGVRLSIGVNDGRELKCQYHGWRYSNRTAECTYIPAHPADAPARTIRNRAYEVIERHGLVWTTFEPDLPVDIPELATGEESLVLRAVPVSVSAPTVLRALRDGLDAGLELIDSGENHCVYLGSEHQDALTVVVQPRDQGAAILRGVRDGVVADGTRSLAILRRDNEMLTRWARRLEADHVGSGSPVVASPVVDESSYDLVSEDLAGLPEPVAAGRAVQLRVRVERAWLAAEDVRAFRLAPLAGHLPVAQPGSHIDVHLPNGLIRQYSVVNAAGEDDRYVIGVKREPESRGGSTCLHEVVRENDVLAVSLPRNNFVLRRDAEHTTLIAGGIGITPLLPMTRTLLRHGLETELHYFARSQEHVAFEDRLEPLSPVTHLGLDPAGTRAALQEAFAGYRPGRQAYLCGPGPLIEGARAVAAEAGWPEGKLHFEYFKNTRDISKESAFQVALARSCLTVDVGPGETILEAVRAAGVGMPSSCEQGACGTCLARVIEGDPVHQDVYLGSAEKASGESIITCVSRASSPRLVLDL